VAARPAHVDEKSSARPSIADNSSGLCSDNAVALLEPVRVLRGSDH
jgi:hypothetical protein